MGDLLPFNRQRKKESVVTSVPIVSEAEIHNSVVNYLPPIEESEEVGFQIVLMDITLHLNGLRGHVSRRNIEIRRNELKRYTLDELQRMAQDSTENDWTIHPAFYRALVEELNLRMKKSTE